MKNSYRKNSDNLRRNRIIGVVVFVLLIMVCWLCWHWYVNSVEESLPNRTDKTMTETVTGGDINEDDSVGKPPFDTGKSGKDKPRKVKNSTDSETSRPTSENPSNSTLTNLELPLYGDSDLVLFNEEGRYALLYDTLNRQASWVAYLLTASDVKSKKVERTNNFIPDPEVLDQGLPTAYSSHYSGSGYDRGHLCPSADRATSRQENQATFYMSNIAPQTPELNQGIWNDLEQQVRRWAVKYDSVYVATGSVFPDSLVTISGGVGVPEYFYKALLTRSNGKYYSIGFIFPNARHFSPDIRYYSVSIDSLEHFTSIDFFHNLPDDIESAVESVRSDKFWFKGLPYH